MCTKKFDTVFVGAHWMLAVESDEAERIERATVTFGVDGDYVGSPFF